MFFQDAVIMLDRLTIELRFVTKVDVDKTFAALETCCLLAEYELHMRYCLGKVYDNYCHSNIQACVPLEPWESLQCLCKFCPIIWK